MEYSKLLIVLCLFIAIINALPVPPTDPSSFLEENEVLVETQEEEEITETPAQEEPVDEEPVFVNTDVNSVVADNIGNITNDILGTVSFAIKTALEKELGSESNEASTNGAVNDVIVDLLNKTSDSIKSTVDNILETDIGNTDLKSIATDTADKIGEILGQDMVGSIFENINDKLDIKGKLDAVDAKKILGNTVKSVEDFLNKNLETTKAVVEKTSDDVIESISNANDIASVVTNGVSYLIKSTLCESLENDDKEICNNLSESVIENSATIINEIISSNINLVSGEGLTVACALIPSDVFEKLTSVVVNAITDKIDGEKVSTITNKILTIIINSIEDLLCANKIDAVKAGSVLLKDVSSIATHIINKVNNINTGVVSSLNDKETNSAVATNIANDISGIQESLKE